MGIGSNGKQGGGVGVEKGTEQSMGKGIRESKAARKRRWMKALTCLLVVLGVLHRLRVGNALKPAVLALDQERWEGGRRGRTRHFGAYSAPKVWGCFGPWHSPGRPSRTRHSALMVMGGSCRSTAQSGWGQRENTIKLGKRITNTMEVLEMQPSAHPGGSFVAWDGDPTLLIERGNRGPIPLHPQLCRYWRC